MIGAPETDAELLAGWSKHLISVFTADPAMAEPVRQVKAEMDPLMEALTAQAKQIEELTRRVASMNKDPKGAHKTQAAAVAMKRPRNKQTPEKTNVKRKNDESNSELKLLAKNLLGAVGGPVLMKGLMGEDFVKRLRAEQPDRMEEDEDDDDEASETSEAEDGEIR